MTDTTSWDEGETNKIPNYHFPETLWARTLLNFRSFQKTKHNFHSTLVPLSSQWQLPPFQIHACHALLVTTTASNDRCLSWRPPSDRAGEHTNVKLWDEGYCFLVMSIRATEGWDLKQQTTSLATTALPSLNSSHAGIRWSARLMYSFTRQQASVDVWLQPRACAVHQ